MILLSRIIYFLLLLTVKVVAIAVLLHDDRRNHILAMAKKPDFYLIFIAKHIQIRKYHVKTSRVFPANWEKN